MVGTVLFYAGFFMIGWCSMDLWEDYRHGYPLRLSGLAFAVVVGGIGWWLRW